MSGKRPAAAVPLLAAAVVLLFGAAGGAGAPAASAAADPFYLDLLRDGVQSYDRADYPAAAKRLRLACFGMLDEPMQLAACLTRLGLAQAAAGDADAFRETFRRIVEVEDRFGAYGKADLPPEVRAAFEQRVLAGVPAGTLEAIPAWRALLGRKVEAQIAALPPRERRRQLEERLAREPKSVAWNVMLAELDLAEGKTAAAIGRAEATAALVPPDPRASCVRGLARAAGNRCREALADLESCTQGAADLRYVTALLGCRVELAQWRQAEEQVRALPAAFRQDRKVAALMQQVAKHPSATGAGSGGPPAAAAAGKSQTAAVLAPATAPGAAHRPAGASSTPAAASAGAAARTPAAGTGGGASGAAPSGNVSGDPRSTGTAAAPQGAPATAAPPPPAASRPAAPMSAAERAAMARSESLLTATAMPDLREALRLARQLADAHPDSKEAQYLAGKAAYRNSRWTEAATYFRRGGPPADDHPELLFYMAVAYYEVGDRPGAAAALKRSLPNLQKTPFVESYVKRILGQ